jgi:hypothetical protein
MEFVRRSLRARALSNCSAISGRFVIHVRSAGRSMLTARTSVTVVAVDVRGPGSKIDSSPNMSEGPKIPSRFSRPSGDFRPIFTLPDWMMYSRSPGSPSAKITWPRGNSTDSSVCASASAAAGSTPWKMPARARVSSTSSLLSRRDGMVVRLPPFGGACAVPSITECSLRVVRWIAFRLAVPSGDRLIFANPRQPGKAHEGCFVDL